MADLAAPFLLAGVRTPVLVFIPPRPVLVWLAHRRTLSRDALARLAEVDDAPVEALDDAVPLTLDEADQPADQPAGEPADGSAAGPADETVPLARLRRRAVLAVLRDVGARSVAHHR